MSNYRVDIPKEYLLTIAVYGNMGDGKLPDMMRLWAQKECERLGIRDEMIEMQKEHVRELEIRLRNVLGDEAIDKLAGDIKLVGKALNKVLHE